jgi:hypothetical protein
MRFPNPRLLRIGAVTGGYIAEPGDGELALPPVLQPVCDLSEPISVCYTAGVVAPVPITFSCIKNDLVVRGGAGAASVLTLLNLGRGLWNVDINTAFGFIGTTATANDSGVQLIDPANNVAQLTHMFHFNAQHTHFSFTLKLCADRDGYILALRCGTTVGADNIFISAAVVARKIL